MVVYDPRPYLKKTLQRLKSEEQFYLKTCVHNIKNRFERAISKNISNNKSADALVLKINTLFYTGMGVTWSPVQSKIYVAIMDGVLPLIYGSHWNENKARVMFTRKLSKIAQEVLIQMARRNGKTFVVAGVATALLLTIPGITIAIFSVSDRQSKMLKDEIDKRVRKAWELGNVVTKDDYTKIESNKETWLYMMNSTGTRQRLGAFPGSSRVS